MDPYSNFSFHSTHKFSIINFESASNMTLKCIPLDSDLSYIRILYTKSILFYVPFCKRDILEYLFQYIKASTFQNFVCLLVGSKLRS